MQGDWVDWLGAVVTGLIAYHGLTYRDARGERPWLHLLFGAMALMFCLRFVFSDILGVW